MAIDRQQLMNWSIPEVRHSYTERDTMLYALGLGAASDPSDERDIRYVFEKNLVAFPMMAVVLGYPGLWMRDQALNINWQQMLHGEQGLQLYKPLPVAGTVIGRTRVIDVIDKGAGKGAVVYTERDVLEDQTQELLCRLSMTSLLRADGGFGGRTGPVQPPIRLPARAPDFVREYKVMPQAAFIYRLSGDYNPLHADSTLAREAGFKGPILHGLCTFGMAGRAVLAEVLNNEVDQLTALRARFTAPVYPCDTLSTEIWTDGPDIWFRTSVPERNVVVLNNGYASRGDA